MLPFELTKDTPYLALSGELWSVFYEYFNRNWSCYKGFLLYVLFDDYPDFESNGVYKCGTTASNAFQSILFNPDNMFHMYFANYDSVT